MAILLGLGPGIYILAFIWTVCFIGCIFMLRSENLAGAIGPVCGSLLITLILWFIPRESADTKEDNDEIVDRMFIPRTCLLVFMCLSFIAAIVLYIIHLTEPVYAKPVIGYKRLQRT